MSKFLQDGLTFVEKSLWEITDFFNTILEIALTDAEKVSTTF
jgi:hypothetical protein